MSASDLSCRTISSTHFQSGFQDRRISSQKTACSAAVHGRTLSRAFLDGVPVVDSSSSCSILEGEARFLVGDFFFAVAGALTASLSLRTLCPVLDMMELESLSATMGESARCFSRCCKERDGCEQSPRLVPLLSQAQESNACRRSPMGETRTSF